MSNLKENSLQQRNVQPRGIDAILAQSQQRKFYQQPAYIALQDLLTLDGRIPLEQALESLTPTERCILEMTQQRANLSIAPCENASVLPDHACLVVQERRVGHISLLFAGELRAYPLAEDHFFAGVICFSPEDYAALLTCDRISREVFRGQAEEAYQALQAMEQTGELEGVIGLIRDTLSRMAPLVVYVWHQVYSTFDQAGKNLLDSKAQNGEKRVLSSLLSKPVSQWQVEEQIFIYCTYILLQSGGPYRLEEMNSSQFSLTVIQTFLDKKARLYNRYSGRQLPADWSSLSLLRKAQWLARQRSIIDEHCQRYRLIHGISMRKEERITSQLSQRARMTLRPPLVDKIHQIFGLYPREGEARSAYWRRVTYHVIAMEKAYRQQNIDLVGADGPPLAMLIGVIVWTVAEATASDVAMSSFVRDLSKLSTAGPLSLEKQDFYCCALPSTEMVARHPADRLSEMLRMISARMQFNRWHFIPSNVDHDTISVRRNWFYAPTIPDIAIWSDQHHAGHVEVSVRHSIRYPSSLALFGRRYTGIYDLRLMRQQGQPYSLEEMHTCGSYVIDMEYVLQTIAEYVEESGESVTIDSFDAAWYKSQIWQQWVDTIVAKTVNNEEIDTGYGTAI